MSDVISGVIVGGAIGSLLPFATLLFQYVKWRQGTRLAHLKSERDRLQALFDEITPQIADGIASGKWPAPLAATLQYRCPESVFKRIGAWLKDAEDVRDTGDPARVGRYFHEVVYAMQAELARLDKGIERVSMGRWWGGLAK